MIKIPYGKSDYRTMIENGYFYQDRTSYLQTLEDWGPTYLLFLRPRRFGKSLWISTLHYYYGVQYKENFEALFGNTFIGKNPTPKANEYLVLSFDFSGINTETPRGVFDGFLSNTLKGVNAFMEAYPTFFTEEKIKSVLSQKEPHEVLKELFSYLHKTRFEKKVYVLIDEYDHFANELISFNFNHFGDIVTKNGFVRKFYEVLKIATGSGMVERIFMTGVSPVTVDSLTSGFNIANNITLEKSFHQMVGFDEREVVGLLEKIDVSTELLSAVMNDLRLWYNGYWFNPDVTVKVYNPNMVLYFANSYQANQGYPREMLDINIASDYKKIKKLFNIQGRQEQHLEILQRLLETGEITSPLTAQYNFERHFSQSDLVSLLFYMGFLTIKKESIGGYTFAFPNYVIKKLYADFFVDSLLEEAKLPIDNMPVNNALREMATSGNPQDFFNQVQLILKYFSTRDTAHFNENTLKAVIISLLHQQNFYYIHSEYETDWTYMDVFLEPIYGQKPNFEVAMELKYIQKSTKKNKENIFEAASAQLKNYLETPKFNTRKTVKSFVVVVVGDKLEWRELK
ncbi:MAG: hypothetical protein RLZZ292_2456 [Bacteroidota bacterium]|jgi:hypothetical protein